MQVLTRRPAGLWCVAFCLAVAACSQKSPEYKEIHDLPYDEWVNYAKALPLEKRFQLHQEIAAHDGPNPPQRISESFYNQPEESYRYMVEQLRAGAQHPEFLGVIFAIQRNPEFDLCKMPDKDIIQAFLDSTKGFTVKDEHRPAFYDC